MNSKDQKIERLTERVAVLEFLLAEVSAELKFRAPDAFLSVGKLVSAGQVYNDDRR